ncbi:MAG: hypothetical protein ACLU9S_11800 [Oscillospiraceae bacterium]
MAWRQSAPGAGAAACPVVAFWWSTTGGGTAPVTQGVPRTEVFVRGLCP